MENPLGIGIARPLLGWKLSSVERNQCQTAYELMVAASGEELERERNILWSSGKIISGQSFNIPYDGPPPRPFTRYYWKVRAYDREGRASEWSPAAHWETAMLSPSDWAARWIGDGSAAPAREEDFYKDDPAPVFRKTFQVAKPLARARLYITGLGYYEATLNGRAVGDRRLDPGWTNYGKQILYSAFDITPLLRPGDNAAGVMLGNGFFNPLPMKIFRPLRNFLYIGRPCFIAQIRLTYADGSEETIITDESWKTGPGLVMRNNVYLGEHYDARNEQAGWDTPGFDDGAWRPAVRAAAPAGRLSAQMQPPVRVTRVSRPARMTEVRPGAFIFDMGQNMAGVVRIKVRGPRGARINIRYGEDVFPDGSLNVMTSVAGQQKRVWNANLDAPGQPPVAWQQDSYTLKGGEEETWSPRFTFHGFRYVEITGWPGRPGMDNVEALRMNADLPRAGTFDCSSPLLRKLHTTLDNTFLSNVLGVQSDCPAREKFGYGGDIVATARAFCWFYDMGNFYRKVTDDFASDQRPSGGMTETAPYNGIADKGLGDGSGPIGWQLAFAFLQKQLYEYYGDIRVIQACYPALLKQVEFLRSKAVGHIIDRCINDHESLEPRIPELFATAHYYHHVLLLSEFARLTGRTGDAEEYTRLAANIKGAFIQRFARAGSGEIGNHTPAAQAFALFYDLLPVNEKEAAFKVLLQEIEKRDGHVSSGIFGVPLVLDALVKNDRNDVAFQMVTKKTFPGWGHMLESGATTLWETWKYSDNVYSHNHPMFGSVGEWLYQGVLGISQGAPGFKKIIFKPQPAGDLAWASGSYESLWGTIASSWKMENNRFTHDITVPAGASAEVWIPAGDITESGKPAGGTEEVRFLREEKNHAIFEVKSGKYTFISIPRT
ncbi:MAG: glycoside hydrolase family 78 protein [Opitutaceae bacterium]|nr:glycoside hydrolase family 78 protein [Opitutaceae bacterium]